MADSTTDATSDPPSDPPSDPSPDPPSDPPSDPAPGGRARPETTTERRPTWPVTLLVVVCAYLLAAWNLWVAGISTAPFFGDIPSRDNYIRAGMAALTGVLPGLLLAVAGWLAGSRWGVLLIGLPTAVLLGVGASMVTDPGDQRDPSPGRGVVASDVVGDYTLFNWLVCAVLAAVIAAMAWSRRSRG